MNVNGNSSKYNVLDDLFIDWRAELTHKNKLDDDWDVGSEEATVQGSIANEKSDSDEKGDKNLPLHKMRTFGEINLSNAFKVRKEKPLPDPLFARIESEPITPT